MLPKARFIPNLLLLWCHAWLLSAICPSAAARLLDEVDIVVPADIQQCHPTTIRWSGGAPPYVFSISNGGPFLVNIAANFYTWDTNVPAGTVVRISVIPRGGIPGGVTRIVGSSTDNNCLNVGRLYPSPTGSHPSETSTTSPMPRPPAPQTPLTSTKPDESITTSGHSATDYYTSSPTEPSSSRSPSQSSASSPTPPLSFPSSNIASGRSNDATSISTTSLHYAASSSSSSGLGILSTTLSSSSPTAVAELQHGSSSHGPNTGLILGLVVGCAAIVLALSAVFYRRSKRRCSKATGERARHSPSRTTSVLISDISSTTEPPSRLFLPSRQAVLSNETVLGHTLGITYEDLGHSLTPVTESVCSHIPSPLSTVQETRPTFLVKEKQRTEADTIPSTRAIDLSLSLLTPQACDINTHAPSSSLSQGRVSLEASQWGEESTGSRFAYEVDGGVRLAGGPPGEEANAVDGMCEVETVILPPPYQRY